MIKCYCVIGMMSKCTATDKEQQRMCHFSEKATVTDRCMYRNESIGNHCDCLDAQIFARTGKVEEVEIDIDDHIVDDPIEALEMITSCATCEKIDSDYCSGCKMWPHLEGAEMRELARCCDGFELTASCVMCKFHDDCHNGTSGDNYSLIDKINIAQTCKKYDPITNNGPIEEDDIPF